LPSAKTVSFRSAHAAKALGRLQSQFVESVCAATMGAVRSDFVRPGVGAFSAHPTLHEHGILRCQDAVQPFLLRQGKINPVECRRGMTGFRLLLLLGGRDMVDGRRRCFIQLPTFGICFWCGGGGHTREQRVLCERPDYS